MNNLLFRNSYTKGLAQIRPWSMAHFRAVEDITNASRAYTGLLKLPHDMMPFLINKMSVLLRPYCCSAISIPPVLDPLHLPRHYIPFQLRSPKSKKRSNN